MYTVTTTLTTGETHTYQLDTLDQVDQFVGKIQYRGDSQLVAVSDSPITLTYGSNIRHVTIDGVTREAITAYDQEKREQHAANYEKLLAEKRAGGQIGYGLNTGLAEPNLAVQAETALARVVR